MLKAGTVVHFSEIVPSNVADTMQCCNQTTRRHIPEDSIFMSYIALCVVYVAVMM